MPARSTISETGKIIIQIKIYLIQLRWYIWRNMRWTMIEEDTGVIHWFPFFSLITVFFRTRLDDPSHLLFAIQVGGFNHVDNVVKDMFEYAMDYELESRTASTFTKIFLTKERLRRVNVLDMDLDVQKVSQDFVRPASPTLMSRHSPLSHSFDFFPHVIVIFATTSLRLDHCLAQNLETYFWRYSQRIPHWVMWPNTVQNCS